MSKFAVITGGAKGIGKSISEAFIKEGYSVTILYNQSEKSALEMQKKYGIDIIKADVSKQSEVAEAFSKIAKIDVLVNNSGVSLNKLIIDTTEDDYDAVMNVNLKGVFLCSKCAIEKMLARKSGSIINISSMWGRYGGSMESVYSASKAGVNGLTVSLAREWGISGIRVNAICCGAIDTDMLSGFSENEILQIAENCSLNRIGKVGDIANAALFLADDKANFITGQCISVDGGY